MDEHNSHDGRYWDDCGDCQANQEAKRATQLWEFMSPAEIASGNALQMTLGELLSRVGYIEGS